MIATTVFYTTLPADIEKSLIELHDVDQDINNINTDLTGVKADIRSGVLAETVDGTHDGKPKYTNDPARAAAVAVAEANNPLIFEANKTIRTLQATKNQIVARIERQKMEFKVHLLDRELEIAAYQAKAA